MNEMVLGVFSNKDNVEKALYDLKDAGLETKEISVIMREIKDEEDGGGSQVVEGATSGAATGGVIGGLAGLLIGIGAIAVPGVGALLIGGPVAAALGLTGAAAATVSGAVTGILAGGLVGGLVGLGVPEEHAKEYEERVKKGDILLGVPVKEDEEEKVRKILEDNGAENVRTVTSS